MAEGDQLRLRRPRNFGERKDVLNELSDAELIKRYRLDRAGIMFVTDLIRKYITSPTARNKAVSPELKVIITLRFLATGKMQTCHSDDDLGPSQHSVRRIITETLNALSSLRILTQFIKFPITPNDIQRMKMEFMQISGFPGVIGVIDGTHVRIKAPKKFGAEYINRKGYHSINTQVVFDAQYKIIDIVANWPGSVHDARILNESALKRVVFGRGMVPEGCHLLGDSGYPCKKWLLTPYLQPQPGPQSNYNRAHERTRSVVERGIDQLKRRFHVLHGEIRVTPPGKVCQIIEVCAMLHNICKDRNIQIPVPAGENLNIVEDDDQQPLEPQPAAEWPLEDLRYRDEFVNLHFKGDCVQNQGLALGTCKPKTPPKGNGEHCQNVLLKEEEESYRDFQSKIIGHCLDSGIKAEEEQYQGCAIKAEEELAIKVEEEIFQEAETTGVKDGWKEEVLSQQQLLPTQQPVSPVLYLPPQQHLAPVLCIPPHQSLPLQQHSTPQVCNPPHSHTQLLYLPPQKPEQSQQHPTTVLYLPSILCLSPQHPLNKHTETIHDQNIVAEGVNQDEESSDKRGKDSAYMLSDENDPRQENVESNENNEEHVEDFADNVDLLGLVSVDSSLNSIDVTKLHQCEDTSEDGHECPECGKVFRGINIHRLAHKVKKLYACPVCGKPFKTQRGMENHRILKHTKEKHHKCTDCSKFFRTRSGLKTHRKQHTGEQPFECPECGKKFSLLATLKLHKMIHTGEKPHECPECGKRFRSSSNLIQHRLSHTTEKQHECPECKKKFRHAKTVKKHILIHTGEKPHECPDCNKRFRLLGDKKSHRLIHSGVRLYKCPECDRRFRRSDYLKKHRLIHTGERPHTCPDCGKKYRHRTPMIKHRLIHSGENLRS